MGSHPLTFIYIPINWVASAWNRIGYIIRSKIMYDFILCFIQNWPTAPMVSTSHPPSSQSLSHTCHPTSSCQWGQDLPPNATLTLTFLGSCPQIVIDWHVICLHHLQYLSMEYFWRLPEWLGNTWKIWKGNLFGSNLDKYLYAWIAQLQVSALFALENN